MHVSSVYVDFILLLKRIIFVIDGILYILNWIFKFINYETLYSSAEYKIEALKIAQEIHYIPESVLSNIKAAPLIYFKGCCLSGPDALYLIQLPAVSLDAISAFRPMRTL